MIQVSKMDMRGPQTLEIFEETLSTSIRAIPREIFEEFEYDMNCKINAIPFLIINILNFSLYGTS